VNEVAGSPLSVT